MFFEHDHEHMGEILEATRSAASLFLESLATRPAGIAQRPLPHDVLPDEGIGAMEARPDWIMRAQPVEQIRVLGSRKIAR